MPSQLSTAEQVALDPVVRRALPVLLEHAGLADGLAVVERALEDDVAKAFDERAMRIAFAIGERVVLAMAGDPFLGDDCGGQPEPEAHRQRRDVVEAHTAMRLGAVQEQRDADVREVTRDHDEQHGHPPSICEGAETWHCKTPLLEKTSPVKLVNVLKPGPRCY